VKVPLTTTALQVLIALMMGFVFTQSVEEWLTRDDRPVEIYGIKITHPILPGSMLHTTIDVQIKRHCVARTVWIITDDNSRTVWSHQSWIGHTPLTKRGKISDTSSTPLPADLPDGDYILIVHRTDQCPERSYSHPPYVTAFRVP